MFYIFKEYMRVFFISIECSICPRDMTQLCLSTGLCSRRLDSMGHINRLSFPRKCSSVHTCWRSEEEGAEVGDLFLGFISVAFS